MPQNVIAHFVAKRLAELNLKSGTYGKSDPLGYSPAENPVDVRDLQATIMHQLGLDPHHFSFPFQGLNQRLIGPANHPEVILDILG